MPDAEIVFQVGEASEGGYTLVRERGSPLRFAINFMGYEHHIAGSVSIDPGDLQYAPFAQRGGIGRAHAVFGDELQEFLEELNLELAG